VRLHEEMTRLTRRINMANNELDNLGKASKAQAKKLSKLRKDLAALQEDRVSLC
jgi:predicted  nucleic acid-binding Zn-ribbon protein